MECFTKSKDVVANRSKKVQIFTCEFHDSNGKITKGFRIVDSSGTAYDNSWISIPNTNFGILCKVMKSKSTVIQEMLEGVEKVGLYINNTWLNEDLVEESLE